jgi:hypothetical protein
MGKCARIFPAGRAKHETVRSCLSVHSSLPRREVKMSHNIAAIDVHKKLLVVVIADSAKPDVPLQSRKFGSGTAE